MILAELYNLKIDGNTTTYTWKITNKTSLDEIYYLKSRVVTADTLAMGKTGPTVASRSYGGCLIKSHKPMGILHMFMRGDFVSNDNGADTVINITYHMDRDMLMESAVLRTMEFGKVKIKGKG